MKTKVLMILLVGVLLSVVFSSDAKAGCPGGIDPITSVEDFCDVRCKDMSSIDLSDRPNLPATLWFNQGTIWPGPVQMPPGCDPDEIMTNAMNPGLGVRAIHQQGITGMGVNVAIIDQPMYLDHPEFSGKIAAYYDTGCGGSESSMHGPAVASLLVGENCGTAPGAQVYYAAVPSWLLDAAYYADALDWVVTQNESLSSSEKIRVVSVSAAPSGPGSPFLYNNVMWDEACALAEAAGILIVDCTDERGFTSRGWYDPNDPENVTKFTAAVPGYPPPSSHEGIYFPVSRAMAEESWEGDFSYFYTGRGGASWTVP
jgi:serine protease AprX